jgi:hypothetical protein
LQLRIIGTALDDGILVWCLDVSRVAQFSLRQFLLSLQAEELGEVIGGLMDISSGFGFGFGFA